MLSLMYIEKQLLLHKSSQVDYKGKYLGILIHA